MVCAEEEDVTVFKEHAFGEGGFFGFGEEFDDGGFPFAVFEADVGEAFGSEFGFDPFLPFFELFFGEGGSGAFGVDGLDDAAGGEDVLEDLECGALEDVGEVLDFDSEAEVWFVGAEAVHGLGVGHSWERDGDFDALGFAEDALEEALDEGLDFGFGDEGGFEVDLSELGLAVGAEVFVAEAASDLEIFFEAADLEQLFVLLWGLGEGVEVARVESCRDEEVACALWGGVGEDGGFDFEEAVFVEEVAGGLGDSVAQFEVVGHFCAAQVEVAVGEAEVLVGDLGIERERGDLGFVEDGEFAGDDLDFAGGEFGVFAAGEA